MKATKKNADSTVWIQLSEKIKDADDSRNRDAKELHDEIFMIFGKKDVKISIPKNSKALNSFRERVH